MNHVHGQTTPAMPRSTRVQHASHTHLRYDLHGPRCAAPHYEALSRMNACMHVRRCVWRCRLPAKQRVDGSGLPLCMAYSDVGLLNTALELWRYPSAQALIE